MILISILRTKLLTVFIDRAPVLFSYLLAVNHIDFKRDSKDFFDVHK